MMNGLRLVLCRRLQGWLSNNLTTGVLLAGLIGCSGLVVSRLLPGVGHAYPLWPGAGFAVALLISRGWVMAPAVAAGSVLANIGLLNDAPALLIGLVFSFTLETVLAAVLARRLAGRRPLLRQPREIVAFLLATGPLSCLVGAVTHIGVLMLNQSWPASQLALIGFTRWAGGSLGIVVFMPAALMVLPEQRKAWTGRRLKLLLPSLLLLLLTVVSVSNAWQFEDQQIKTGIQALAAEANYALLKNIDRHGEAIDSIRRFVLSSNKVTADEFQSFTHDVITRLPGLHALSWNPLIRDDQRAEFEAEQRLDPILPSYGITERSDRGPLVAAGKRARYVPVGLIEPLEENRRALGFDILSNPIRAKAIQLAEINDRRQATDPITLVQERAQQQGVLVLEPVRSDDSSILGFAVGVYRLGDLLTSSFDGMQSKGLDGVHLELRQTKRTDGSNELLAEWGSGDSVVEAQEIVTPIVLGGQEWELALQPSAAFLASRQTTLPQQLLLAGLLLVFSNQAFSLVVTGREQLHRKRALIDQHRANHDSLTKLLNRQAFFSALNEVRAQAGNDGGCHVLLLFDLDHFKPINDQAGHDAGDDVLASIAQILNQAKRPHDILARIGGDEFAAILHDCDQRQGSMIAQRWLDALDITFRWKKHAFPISSSMGLRMIDGTETPMPTTKQLMHDADQACYEAKRSGRNRLVIKSPAHRAINEET